ncbi:hypothetical protein N7509_001521 [Penicillium cosmopolitanum]|uniref:Histidine kinase n=1 Tax=Penicillium cosmopolitanum TaxID=1131564 RepID=A0A9X0BCG9_9EURO|nr:uncharacterized protein N7509_001521 [Penicillium cosmopolitanum]KAJ5407638.1 hypothetical protein N7509_001521 [Penicillium cosmopolitanum]
MVLDQQMLHLSLEDRRPVGFDMLITPPAQNDVNATGALGPSRGQSQSQSQSQSESQSQSQSRDNFGKNHSPLDHPMSRIYRCTPTPTIIIDDSLQVVEVSDSHLALFKHTRAELIGSSIYDLAPRAVPAPDIPLLSGALGASLTTRSVQSIEPIRVAGCDSDFALRVTPIFDDGALIYVVLEAHSIKREPRSQPGLNEEYFLNETYKILVDTVKDYAIFMLDTRGNIATWNSGAAILKGYTPNEIIGQHFSIFYGADDRRARKPARELDVCLREGRVEDEGWRYRKDGSRFWANVMITPIFQLGRHVGFVKVTRDLTERKAAEARLIDAFEESAKLKTDFLANMSHELRTPMNGMFLALTMLMRTSLGDDQREYALILEDSTSILLKVINDVLDYSKLSSGSFSLTTDVVNIPSVVNAVVRNCQPAAKPGLSVVSFIAPDFPSNLEGDSLRFRQVLQNLVSNAVKFTEKGHVHVKASYKVDPYNSQSFDISIEVVDTGIGVPEEAVGTLFTPFTRFADSATKRYQGTGLGLSICKSLAELMKGVVGFRTNPDGPGSIFWMSTKMSRIHDHQTSRSKPSVSPTPIIHDFDPEPLLKKIAPQKHILLVEDNNVNQTIMIKLLGSLGFERVDAAWDGSEAVRMVKQKPLTYNVILMDINMPVMDGMAATKHIRGMKIDVPIIALTGNALKGDAELYLAQGMDDYIAKPLHRQQLIDILWKWCGS